MERKPTTSQPIKPVVQPRLVVVETVYHQQPEEDPICVESRYDRWLNSTEQPYIRRVWLDQEWKPLDIGWIKQAGLLILSNDKNIAGQVRPPIQEQIAASQQIIEVSFVSPDVVQPKRDMHSSSASKPEPMPMCIILPGESMRIHPVTLESIILRCRLGSIRCSISLFPC